MSIPTTSIGELNKIINDASIAATLWGRTSRGSRAKALRLVADSLDGSSTILINQARLETHLTEERLTGELSRTTFQLRFLANCIEDSDYLNTQIDLPNGEWQMGATRPDLRKTALPLGPVVVFAASNFPFAFSVAGGDTASALAAGCPVILKAHSGHPKLSEMVGSIVERTLLEAGAPAGTFKVIYGTESGKYAVAHHLVKAGAFTGSIGAGRALFDIAQQRAEPIPFFGELGSVNPVIISESAANAGTNHLLDGFIASFTASSGQFCTKPGLLLVPENSKLDDVLQKPLNIPPVHPLLNPRIESGYQTELRTMLADSRVEAVSSQASPHTLEDNQLVPQLLLTDIEQVIDDPDSLFVEIFGPSALIVRYRTEDELIRFSEIMPGQLTAGIFAEESDLMESPAFWDEIIFRLSNRAGRLLWNQWPTGVSVTYSQQHGGPYPSSTTSTTSVGSDALKRFLRPVAFQNFPSQLLPEEIR